MTPEEALHQIELIYASARLEFREFEPTPYGLELALAHWERIVVHCAWMHLYSREPDRQAPHADDLRWLRSQQ